VFNLVFHQSIGRFNPFDSSIDISYAYHHSGSFCTHFIYWWKMELFVFSRRSNSSFVMENKHLECKWLMHF